MATAAQIIANRANAQLSTGAKTPEGKLASSSNALRTGLTSAKLFIRDEDRARFDAFQTGLVQEMKPEGEMQKHLYDTILHATWNIQRTITLEAELEREALDRGLLTAAFDDELARGLDRLWRYKKMHENTLRRSTADLRALQNEAALRKGTQTEDSILVSTAVLLKAAAQPHSSPSSRQSMTGSIPVPPDAQRTAPAPAS